MTDAEQKVIDAAKGLMARQLFCATDEARAAWCELRQSVAALDAPPDPAVEAANQLALWLESFCPTRFTEGSVRAMAERFRTFAAAAERRAREGCLEIVKQQPSCGSLTTTSTSHFINREQTVNAIRATIKQEPQ